MSRRLTLPFTFAILFLAAAATSLAENRVITIYFCGTSATSEWNRADKSPFHQPEHVATLYANDGSHEVRKTWVENILGSDVVRAVGVDSGYSHYRYIVNGIGTPNNVFESADPDTWGPRTWQAVVDEATTVISTIIDKNPGDTFALNMVGWSRGGILCMKTARAVANSPVINPSITAINILAYDPVHGGLDPIGRYPDDFKLPAKVSQFVGLYATHEMMHMFEPVIPWSESASTSMWIVRLPGSHDTMVGSCQSDGHHELAFDGDYSCELHLQHIGDLTMAIAEQLLNSPAWGQVPVIMSSQANVEDVFRSFADSVWDHNYDAIMNAPTIFGWSLILPCHPEMIRSWDIALSRAATARFCFLAPNRHEPHLSYPWPCSWIPIYYNPDLMYWLVEKVPPLRPRGWDTLQQYRQAVPPGMDTTPPVPTVALLPDAIGECSVTVARPTAEDVVSGTITGTTPDPLSYTAQGTYSITWTYRDRAGNSTTQTQRVIVKDTIGPVITAPPDVTESTAPDNPGCGVTISEARLGTATATDECSGSRTVSRTGVPAGNVFPVGTTTITYSTTDAAGNPATAEQLVTVIDRTPPTLVVPAGIVVSAEPNRCAAVVTYTVTATDCSAVTVTTSRASGSDFSKGTTNVVVTATDSAGNTTTKNFNVTVVDTEPPKITGVSATPAVLWPPNHQLVDVTVDYAATDNCDQGVCTLSVASNEPVDGMGDGDTAPDWEIVGPRQVRLRAERGGNGVGRIYTITIACADTAGKVSYSSLTVTVPQRKQ